MDMDPQANLTTGVGIEEKNQTIYEALKGQISLKESVKKDIFKDININMDIIPSHIKLANAELELSGELGRETLLKEAYQKANFNDYDYIIIDCNPSLGLLTINALTLANEIIIPVEPSIFALEGIEQLINVINLIRKKMNSSLSIMGVLLTRVDSRTIIAQEFSSDLKNIFKDKMFNVVIHQNVDIAKAQAEQLPVLQFNKKAKSTQEYIELAKEVLKYYE